MSVETILDLKSKSELIKSMGSNAKLLAEKHFDRIKMAELFEETLVEATSLNKK